MRSFFDMCMTWWWSITMSAVKMRIIIKGYRFCVCLCGRCCLSLTKGDVNWYMLLLHCLASIKLITNNKSSFSFIFIVWSNTLIIQIMYWISNLSCSYHQIMKYSFRCDITNRKLIYFDATSIKQIKISKERFTNEIMMLNSSNNVKIMFFPRKLKNYNIINLSIKITFKWDNIDQLLVIIYEQHFNPKHQCKIWPFNTMFLAWLIFE